jgi:hypothetical protein
MYYTNIYVYIIHIKKNVNSYTYINNGYIASLIDYRRIRRINSITNVTGSLYNCHHTHFPVARTATPVNYVMAHRRYNTLSVCFRLNRLLCRNRVHIQ